MIIKELYIKNFGNISERRFRFHQGIQIMEGENETGKTTMHAFIKAMFFGLDRARGKAAAKDDFTRFEPWDEPGRYSGIMRFSCGGKNFRLERDFARHTKRASLVCEDDGEELSVDQGDLSVLLGGLTPELFDSTVSVGQLRAAPGQTLYLALENYAANYMETGGGDIDLDGAFRMLREKKREAERRKKEEEKLFDKERNRISQECKFLEHDMEKLQEEYQELEEKLKDVSETSEQDDSPDTGTMQGKKTIIWGTLGLLAGCAGLLWSGFVSGYDFMSFTPVGVMAVIIAVAGCLLVCAGAVMHIKEKRISPGGKIYDRAVPHDELKKIQWELDRVRREWKEKEIRHGNLLEQYEETAYSDTWKSCSRQCRALEIAVSELRKAAEETGKSVSSEISRKASEIISFLTSEKYQRLFVSENGKIEVWDGEKRIPAERLSRGTVEQIYFSVRLASAEMLLDEEMPLIFDDAFAFYDEKRLKSALKWLSGLKNQVIIFTCHKREKEIFEKEVIS